MYFTVNILGMEQFYSEKEDPGLRLAGRVWEGGVYVEPAAPDSQKSYPQAGGQLRGVKGEQTGTQREAGCGKGGERGQWKRSDEG